MRTLLRVLMIAVSALATVRPLAAQTVLGSVVLPDSTPVVGAIVTATDARGAMVGRALTSQRGSFVLRLPDAGRIRLGVLRIGYRPTEGPSLAVAENGTERVRIVFTAAAVTLAATGVRERETCRVGADTGLIVARVWEEARKAMLTSQLGSDEGGAAMFAEWIEFDRTLDAAGRVVREQRVRSSRNPTTRAFKSVPAEVLREKGFVVAASNGTIYYAPDADVLLSDAFVAGHCFRLVTSPAERTNLVGVGFAPTRERRDMREIEGTLWVDRTTSELKTLEFRYVNLPDAAEPAHPGGLVEFRRLPDGNWFVSRWSVRMPRLTARERTSDNGLRRTVMSLTPMVLRAVQVTGGEVTRAMRGDSVVYRALGPSIIVQVLARDSMVSAASATLTLDGTDYRGTADEAGRIRVSPVLAGRYRASVRTPLMDLLGLPPVAREVETRDDSHVDSLALPTARDALASACSRGSIQDGEGMLHGRVRDEKARAIGGTVVTATWLTAFSMIGMRDGEHLAYTERTLQARSDEAGRWQMCGVPTNAVPTLTVATDSGFDRQRVPMNDRLLATVDLVLHRPIASAGEFDALVRPAEHSLVEIVVTDVRGAPLPETTLEVQPAGRAMRTVVTGVAGAALMPDVVPGVLTLRARHIGFTPGQLSSNVAPGRVTLPIVMSSVTTPVLDTVRTVGAKGAPARLDDFETRRLNHQATVSITRDEIERRNPVDTWQMLMNIPSVTIADRDNMVVATSKRAMISRFDNEPCFLLVMVDGVMLNKSATQLGFDLRQLPRPSEIHGIEVFNGPAAIPLQYGGAGRGTWCGLIAIWTR